MRINSLTIPLDYTHPYWTDNFATLKSYIMTALGYPLVRVELTETMMCQGIHDSVSQLFKYGENTTSLFVETFSIASDGSIELPPRISPSMIRDVLFSATPNSFGFVNPIDEGIYATLPMSSFVNMNGGSLDLGQYYMARTQLADANALTGRTRSWEHINGKLQIFPTSLNNEIRQVGVLYGKILEPEELASDDWVRRYAVAACSVILGRLRRKFSGYAAAGGSSSNDGESLISDAKQEMIDLIQELKDSRSGLPMGQF
jgi:hypothetical protein